MNIDNLLYYDLLNFIKFSFFIFIILLLYVLIKELIKGVKVKHYKKEEMMNSKFDLIYNRLDSVNNYHRIKKIDENMLVFINEYTINIIMTYDYDGNIIIKNDVCILKEGLKDIIIKNPYKEFRNKEKNLNLPNNECNKYLLLKEFCILTKIDPEIEIIRTNNLFFKLNKKEISKKYTKEQIDQFIDKM